MAKMLMLITSLAYGGAERCASELSLNLSPDIEREIFTLVNKTSYPISDKVISLDLDLDRLKSRLKYIYILYGLLIGIVKYRRIIKDYAPDVSLSFLALDNTINVLSTLGNRKVKKIVSVHIALSEKFKNPLIYLLARPYFHFLYNRADIVIAVSNGVKDELVEEFRIDPAKIRVLFNPADIKQIDRLAGESVDDEAWFNGKIPVIMNMGRLTRQKGQWHLIRAFSKVRKSRECKLIIRGDGTLKAYLQQLADDSGLSKDVKFLGWKQNPYKYLSRSSIFALSSLWEALPYAMVEAMACGCPIISTDCKYGPGEILRNGECGILVPKMDGIWYTASDPLTPGEEALADAILKLLDSDGLRMGYAEKSKARAMDFDKGRVIKDYESLILPGQN